MKMATRLILLSSFFLSLFFVGPVFSQEFSADITETTQSGTYSGQIFVTKDKVRLETPESIMISRQDRDIIWMVMPNQKAYIEEPFDTSHIISVEGNLSNEVERQLVGTETINGKETDKYRVVFEMLGKKIGVLQWVDKATVEPVKTQAEDGSWTIEYRNLVKGPQPSSLFEVPEGYQKLEAPALPTGTPSMSAPY